MKKTCFALFVLFLSVSGAFASSQALVVKVVRGTTVIAVCRGSWEHVIDCVDEVMESPVCDDGGCDIMM